jgi:hypothetical protein
MKSGLTGGRRLGLGLGLSPGLVTIGPLSAFAFLLETTGADVNQVSDVGREVGGVGMNAGTGFRQPIPRGFEGGIVAIRRLILPQLGS